MLNAKFTPSARKYLKKYFEGVSKNISIEKLVLQSKKRRVKNIIKSCKTKIKENAVSEKDILKIMDAEQIVAEIYPELISRNIKYIVSDLKTALIELNLGFIKKSAARKKLKSLLRDIKTYNEI